MASVTFITRDGESHTVSATAGSVMELAKNNNIRGIPGNCGGVCACATCHVHVRPADMDRVGQPNENEADMLELADDATEYSRLCCQIEVSDAIDGITLEVVN